MGSPFGVVRSGWVERVRSCVVARPGRLTLLPGRDGGDYFVFGIVWSSCFRSELVDCVGSLKSEVPTFQNSCS